VWLKQWWVTWWAPLLETRGIHLAFRATVGDVGHCCSKCALETRRCRRDLSCISSNSRQVCLPLLETQVGEGSACSVLVDIMRLRAYLVRLPSRCCGNLSSPPVRVEKGLRGQALPICVERPGGGEGFIPFLFASKTRGEGESSRWWQTPSIRISSDGGVGGRQRGTMNERRG